MGLEGKLCRHVIKFCGKAIESTLSSWFTFAMLSLFLFGWLARFIIIAACYTMLNVHCVMYEDCLEITGESLCLNITWRKCFNLGFRWKPPSPPPVQPIIVENERQLFCVMGRYILAILYWSLLLSEIGNLWCRHMEKNQIIILHVLVACCIWL